MQYHEHIVNLANLLKEYNYNFALTGAGISTESGIPDFRSPGTGLWTKIDPVKAATLSVLRRDPKSFYEINLPRWVTFTEAKPNEAHVALAHLEKLGYIEGVVTQNVDGLHRKSGSEKVWEVHGHFRTCHCMKCAVSYPFDLLVTKFNHNQNPPLCDACSGVLRPDVVLFEDQMSEDFSQASQALSGCQLMIVAGSSLQVYPVANLPRLARRLVIINRESTPWDAQAELILPYSTGQVFRDLMTELGEPL